MGIRLNSHGKMVTPPPYLTPLEYVYSVRRFWDLRIPRIDLVSRWKRIIVSVGGVWMHGCGRAGAGAMVAARLGTDSAWRGTWNEPNSYACSACVPAVRADLQAGKTIRDGAGAPEHSRSESAPTRSRHMNQA